MGSHKCSYLYVQKSLQLHQQSDHGLLAHGFAVEPVALHASILLQPVLGQFHELVLCRDAGLEVGLGVEGSEFLTYHIARYGIYLISLVILYESNASMFCRAVLPAFFTKTKTIAAFYSFYLDKHFVSVYK